MSHHAHPDIFANEMHSPEVICSFLLICPRCTQDLPNSLNISGNHFFLIHWIAEEKN